MKRFKILFSLFLLMVGTVVAYADNLTAGTPLAVETVPVGYYLIGSKSESAFNISNPYIAPNGGSMRLIPGSEVTTDVVTSLRGIWKISKTTDGTKYIITSMEDQSKLWVSGPSCPLGNIAGYYNIKYHSDGAYYTFNGDGGANKDNLITNPGAVYAKSATEFGCEDGQEMGKWKLIPVKLVTLNCNYGSGIFTRRYVAPTDVFTPSIPLYKDFSEVTLVDNQDTYDVTCKENFPFEVGKFCKLTIRDNSKYVFWNTEKGYINTRKSASDATGMGALWRFEHVANTYNHVKLYSNAKGRTMAVTFTDLNVNSGKAYLTQPNSGYASTFAISLLNDGFRLANPNNNDANLNDIGGNIGGGEGSVDILGIWKHNDSKTDGGSTFRVVAVGEADQPVQLSLTSLNATDENDKTFTQSLDNTYYWNSTDISGTELVPFYKTTSAKINEGVVTAKVKNNFPFAVSTDVNNLKYSALFTRGYDGNSAYDGYNNIVESRRLYVGVSNGFNNLSGRTTNARYQKAEVQDVATMEWAFMKADDNHPYHFYVYNKSTDKFRLTFDSDAQGTDGIMKKDGNGTPIVIGPNEFTEFNNGFTMRLNDNDKHAIGDHHGGPLAYWSNRGSESELRDQGSIFHVVAAGELLDACKTLVNNNNKVGSLSTSAKQEICGKTVMNDFLAAYNSAIADESKYAAVEATNKLYRIQPVRGNLYIANTGAYADANGNVSDLEASRRIRTAANAAMNADISSVVALEPTGKSGVYRIKNLNSGFYWGTTKKKQNEELFMTRETQYAGNYRIGYTESGRPGYLAFIDTEITADYKYLASRYSEADYQIDNRVGTSDYGGVEPAILFYMNEATTYPITFKNKYATTNLPFDVTLPNNVKAYVIESVTKNADTGYRELNLTQINTTVPANTPVILECTNETAPTATAAVTVNFTMPGTVTSYSGNNILSGSTVKRTGFGDVEYYALANKPLTTGATEKTTAFFRVTTKEMPANKVFLLKNNVPAVAEGGSLALFFNFDGANETTGIVNAKENNASDSNVYYDLNGRRVLYPAHGIYVKANGQKVFIK